MPDQLPPNDPSIPNDELLYVRIFPSRDALQPDGSGGFRPASGSLRRDGQPLSVDLGSLSTPEQTRDRATQAPFHVAAFTAGLARQHGCRVARDREIGNDAHALVIGDHTSGDGSMSKSQTKKIARAATIVLVNPEASGP